MRPWWHVDHVETRHREIIIMQKKIVESVPCLVTPEWTAAAASHTNNLQVHISRAWHSSIPFWSTKRQIIYIFLSKPARSTFFPHPSDMFQHNHPALARSSLTRAAHVQKHQSASRHAPFSTVNTDTKISTARQTNRNWRCGRCFARCHGSSLKTNAHSARTQCSHCSQCSSCSSSAVGVLPPSCCPCKFCCWRCCSVYHTAGAILLYAAVVDMSRNRSTHQGEFRVVRLDCFGLCVFGRGRIDRCTLVR